MINRKDKEILAGYGTLGVFMNCLNALTVHYISLPKRVSEDISDYEFDILDTVYFELDYAECNSLLESLSEVSEDNPKVEIKDWTLNFENYNPKSVEVFIDKTKNILRRVQIGLAC